jgi:CHAD domain-containing protein
LVSPVYFSNGAECLELSDQQIDTGTEMKASFEIDTIRNKFEGALLFKLQKSPGSQQDMDASTTEIDKNESTYIYILVAWKVKGFKHSLYVVLVEHTNEFAWNEDELRKLYDKNHDQFEQYDDIISDTWSVDDNMVLKISSSTKELKGIHEMSISISEENTSDHAMRPLYVDLER